MEKLYIKRLYKDKEICAWYVDGRVVNKKFVKDPRKKEFTNYGDFYDFDFIPKNEVWINQEYGKKEWKFFLKFLITRRQLISEGKNYEEANILASKVEEKERGKLKLVKKLKNVKNIEEIYKRVHKKLLKEYNGKVKIWVVRGYLVRSLFFLDFVQGGHDEVYKFIPKNEVWIDDAISKKEIKYVLVHELHERILMKKGYSYERAHEKSIILEYFLRKNPKKINKVLKQKLKQNNSL